MDKASLLPSRGTNWKETELKRLTTDKGSLTMSSRHALMTHETLSQQEGKRIEKKRNQNL